MERHILRERTSSFHIFFRETGGANTCTPLKARQRPSVRLRVPRSTAILCTQSKSDRVVLITLSPSGYTPVRPECPDALSPSCLLIKMWQLTKAHSVTRNEPKIHGICYITERVDKMVKKTALEITNRVNFIHTHRHRHTHTYIYWQHFFIDTYSIEHNRHFFLAYFYVNPFEWLYWSYDIRRELIDKSSIINYFPSTFCPTLGHHQGRMHYKSDVTFVCRLLFCYCDSRFSVLMLFFQNVICLFQKYSKVLLYLWAAGITLFTTERFLETGPFVVQQKGSWKQITCVV